jgi:hypothetical protein
MRARTGDVLASDCRPGGSSEITPFAEDKGRSARHLSAQSAVGLSKSAACLAEARQAGVRSLQEFATRNDVSGAFAAIPPYARLDGGGALDGVHDGDVRAAKAEVGSHLLLDFIVRWMRSRAPRGLRAHHPAGNAVAALGRLFVDEGLLQFVRLALFEQAFKRCDLARADRGDRHDAGIRRSSFDMNHARAALPQAAAKFGAVQPEFIPQDIEERRRWIGVDPM